MNLNQLAKRVGKSVPAVQTIQRKYGLPVRETYAPGYATLLKKVIYLSVFSVTATAIRELMDDERRLLELLRVDSLCEGQDWFEAICRMRAGPTCQLFTGHDIEVDVIGDAIQPGLDFRERPAELFNDREMGADALKGLKKYAQTLARVQEKLETERRLVRNAVRWSRTLG